MKKTWIIIPAAIMSVSLASCGWTQKLKGTEETYSDSVENFSEALNNLEESRNLTMDVTVRYMDDAGVETSTSGTMRYDAFGYDSEATHEDSITYSGLRLLDDGDYEYYGNSLDELTFQYNAYGKNKTKESISNDIWESFQKDIIPLSAFTKSDFYGKLTYNNDGSYTLDNYNYDSTSITNVSITMKGSYPEKVSYTAHRSAYEFTLYDFGTTKLKDITFPEVSTETAIVIPTTTYTDSDVTTKLDNGYDEYLRMVITSYESHNVMVKCDVFDKEDNFIGGLTLKDTYDSYDLENLMADSTTFRAVRFLDDKYYEYYRGKNDKEGTWTVGGYDTVTRAQMMNDSWTDYFDSILAMDAIPTEEFFMALSYDGKQYTVSSYGSGDDAITDFFITFNDELISEMGYTQNEVKYVICFTDYYNTACQDLTLPEE